MKRSATMKPWAGNRDISITRARPADYATLADLHGLCLEPAWGRQSMSELFTTPGTLGLIARSGGRAVGFALCRRVADESELLALGVLPALRRAGVARAVLDAAIAALAEDGSRAVFLEVAEDNAAGRALYDAAGFVEVGRRADYYARAGAAPMTALVLRKEILDKEILDKAITSS